MTFNPRAREGRDGRSGDGVSVTVTFNPRAREGRDCPPLRQSAASTSFNPRAREGRDADWRAAGLALQAFNPRAREGRDGGFKPLQLSRVLSIHAPARGATSAPFGSAARNNFQSTRPRGARPCADAWTAKELAFNPRAREGRDRLRRRRAACAKLSIHAPARGATDSGCHRMHARMLSIHAPARGATHLHVAELVGEDLSIHAPARGATSSSSAIPSMSSTFNPRAREGRDVVQRAAAHGV